MFHMIAYASMRTDIPAYYSDWLVRRIEEGFVMVRSPYNDHLIYKLPFNPNVIDCLGLCPKDPGKMIPYLDALKNWKTLWHVTITPYGKEYEPGLRDKREIVSAFKNLSLRVGKDRVVWRYDPVFLSPLFSISSHKIWFSTLSSLLEGYTDRVIFSFLDIYPFLKDNMQRLGIRAPEKSEMEELALFFVEEGRKHGLVVSSCAEGDWMKAFGIDTSGCLTKDVWEKCAERKLNFPNKKGKRGECNCILGFDIGGYGGCGMKCVYCYGRNYDGNEVHNPLSPLLFGWPRKEDEIKDVKAESWADKDGWLI